MFTDRVTVKLNAGKGGNGVVAWRREKYIPKGGPCGGNGGRGGSVILVADEQIPSLDWYRNRRMLKAKNGLQGGSNSKQGRSGEDLILRVPCGTLVKDSATGTVICDLIEDGQRIVICQGGRGGRGNESFKSATHRAPNISTQGKLGESKEIELELKLIAHVGLVGFPNAGKSTLIQAVTKAQAKIGAYPFTTLAPNLGFIALEDFSRIYIADIPGIIDGASQNKGLGFEFLRHIERTKILLFILDASGIDDRTPWEDYEVLRKELKAYDPELLNRPYLVALNKCDTDESDVFLPEFYERVDLPKELVFEISAAGGQGLDALCDAIKTKARETGCI